MLIVHGFVFCFFGVFFVHRLWLFQAQILCKIFATDSVTNEEQFNFRQRKTVASSGAQTRDPAVAVQAHEYQATRALDK